MKAIILTGVSGGLGKAFFDILKDTDYYLICLSRSFAEYQLKLAESGNPELIRIDLNEIHEVTQKLNSAILLKNSIMDEIIFINNAGTVAPIGKIGALDEQDLKRSININFISPVLITNFLAAACSKNNIKFKILNISTGAAAKPLAGWSMYCSAKCAARMFFDVAEKDQEIEIENVDPGVLNTRMQDEIRNAAKSDFPLVDYFKNLAAEGKLREPAQVAFNILKKSGLI
jgi:benzil reductase ((S)-benzoin forming)